MLTTVLSSRKMLVVGCVLLLATSLLLYTLKTQQLVPPETGAHGHEQHFRVVGTNQQKSVSDGVDDREPAAMSKPRVQPVKAEAREMETDYKPRKDVIDNSGAQVYLARYDKLFKNAENQPEVQPDPNNPETITTWYQAAAMIDWYIHSPLRHKCKNKVAMGNWHICQDEPYVIKPPCLVYSFGINFDFSFDDAMAKLGCEVHSFDPSMNQSDHKRGERVHFHNLGLSNTNTDGFVARQDIYVSGRQLWKMRTLKGVIRELGHQNRVIDVLKIDVEGHEWAVLDNFMETGIFQYVRQFMLEFHLFKDWPIKEDYTYLYNIYTRLRELGLREFSIGPHPQTLKYHKFNNQGDSEYVNAFFERKDNWR